MHLSSQRSVQENNDVAVDLITQNIRSKLGVQLDAEVFIPAPEVQDAP